MATLVVKEKAIVADVSFPTATWFDIKAGRLLFGPSSRQS
jgi:hypothetical protein